MTTKNLYPHITNVVDISGALFTIKIQNEYTQTQCDEGAKDVNNIWYIGIKPAAISEHVLYKFFSK